MKKFLNQAALFFSLLILSSFSFTASAQTLTLNDGAVLQAKTNRVGVNIGAIDYWDNGQILKNLIGSSNPGLEPLQNRQIWALAVAGTSTTFTVPDIFDTVPANYWAGATFTVTEAQSGGAELGCTGTIASNTGPNYPVASVTTWTSPTITVASSCAAPFAIGDIITISKVTYPTPESWWESGGLGGTQGSISGGGQLLSDTTDLCATCGTQSLNMNASVAGSSAGAAWYFDSASNDNIFILMNGTYQVSFWAKAASGSPTLTVGAVRGSSGGFNCGTYTPKLTSSWAQYTWNCTASEGSATVPAAAQVTFTTKGGSVYLDNVSFEKTSSEAANTTVLRDEVIQALANYYGPSIGNNQGTFRYWVNQNAESMSNWTQPDYARMPSGSGTGYFVGPGGAGSVVLSLEDYLVICQYINAIPYLEVPVNFSPAESAQLIEFLASPSTTTYGARRAALGQTQPWTSVFSTIHLSFCNECWNGTSFDGQALPDRSNQPNYEFYYDYSTVARDAFAAMRADSYYSPTSFDLVMNAQTGTNYSMDIAINRAHPDSIEIEDYTYGTVNSFSTDAALWQPAMVDPWEKVTYPQDIRNFYQSVHDYQSQTTCGPAGTSQCKVNIYEFGQGTINGSIDQTHLDYINAGAGEGVILALQPLLNMQYYGILPQSFFSLTEYGNGAANGMTSKLWGNTVDMGGATNNVRPEFMGISVINQSIIGSMYSCPINNNLTYNFAGSPNGNAPMPAMTAVPYLYAFCFENGTKRSLVLINTDLTASHTLAFGGTNTPNGSVAVRQYAPSDLDEMNEAPTGTATNSTQATSAIETSSLSSPASISLPPFSVTALDYTAQGQAAAAMPTFSPAAGTYTTAQTVTIADSTPNTTIYYTTNGSTPTTSSNVYSTPITVTGNETIQAIAVSSATSSSPASSATYTIDPLLPTPAFTPAAGTYPVAQSVAITEAATGAVIYYTTDGSTPTTSSNVYSGSISVSAAETLNAIAVMTGYTNSTMGTAAYTIAAPLPAPSFSPAPGVYYTSQSVTITAPTSGAAVYYTTDGSTPTTASARYGGAIWQSATQTLNAIAVKSGSSNSAPTMAVYTIAPVLPAPTFPLAGGTAAYSGSQSVTIVESQSGASIHYTTNGTTPTTSSNLYTGPFMASSTETIEAIAVETGYTNSAVSSVLYTIASTVQPPAFSPAAGTYTTKQTVALTDATSGATIYYTTNGTTPTTSSTKYSGVITVSSNETIQAIAVASGYPNSPAASASYTIAPVLPTPAFNLAAGTYTANQTVAISEATAGATIYYTTNGSAPTTSSTVYSGPITVSANETIQAIAAGSGYTNSSVASASYTIAPVLPTPAFNVAAGTYTANQTVAISEATAGTTIYYTTNGATPTTSSTVYSGPITVSANETIQAIAAGTGYTNSSVASASYTIAPVLPTPAFSVAAGTYTANQTVAISEATAGATIYYTTNGATPTTSSTVYSGPITVSANETIQAIAAGTGYTNSSVASASYTIAPVLPTPAFSVAAGTYTANQTVAISEATAGTTIYYTTNGATPTTSSTVYSGPITVSANETIQAIAAGTGYTNSSVASASYTIAPVLPTPAFSVAAGTYTANQTVAISEATAGTTIYYTTNGATPTTSSTVYSGPITVSANETIQAIAAGSGYTNSSVASASYTIAPVLPTPAFSVAAGTYTANQTVAISEASAGTTIYYTTNGSAPTTSSTVYSGPITVSANETIQAIAAGSGYTNSSVASASYTIAPVLVLPAPSFSVASGTFLTSLTVGISDSNPGATIYYTTNGSTPTSSSSVYTGPITVIATETLQAVAVAPGYTTSPVASAAYTLSTVDPVYISYANNNFTATNMSMNFGASINNGMLELTDGGNGEICSAWFESKVPVSAFTTDFTFQLTSAIADGFTFTVQNDPKGIWALGYGGSGLAYQSIQKSVAVKFDIYSDAGEGTDSTGVYTNGAAPTTPAVDMTSSGVILKSGDLMHAHLVYSGTTLTMTLTDTVTGAVFTRQFTVNIPSIVGGTTAYVGFTASTGGGKATQQITSWTYTTP